MGAGRLFVGYLGTASIITALQYLAPVRHVFELHRNEDVCVLHPGTNMGHNCRVGVSALPQASIRATAMRAALGPLDGSYFTREDILGLIA